MFLGEDDLDSGEEDNNNTNQQKQQQKPQNSNSSSNNNNFSKNNNSIPVMQDNNDDFQNIGQKQQQQQQNSYSRGARQKQNSNNNNNSNQNILNNNSQQLNNDNNNNRMKNQQNRFEERYQERVKQLKETGQTQTQQGVGNSDNYHQGIDFSNIQTLSGNNTNAMYEPGTKNKNHDDLPELSKANAKIEFKQENEGKNLQMSDVSSQEEEKEEKNIELIKDMISSDSEEEEEEITEKMKEMKQQHENDKDEEDAAQIVDLIKPEEHDKKSDDEDDDEEEDSEEEKKDPIAKPIDNLDITDMREFLTKPLPKGLLLQCTIKRDKSGMGHFYPKYHVYLSNGVKHIMSGKKRSGNKTSNYMMSMDKSKFDKKSPSFLGKVRSNFMGTEFHIFDTGDNPKENKNYQKIRKELGVVIYESNLMGAKGPRKMRALIPNIKKETGEPVEWKPIQETDSMLNKFKNSQTEGMHFYYNKPPKWNEHVQAFVLNFNGRVDKPSVKNFQLVNDVNDEIIYLQFGRVGDDLFNMDLQYPMSPLQAFGICLSSFDYKIACE